MTNEFSLSLHNNHYSSVDKNFQRRNGSESYLNSALCCDNSVHRSLGEGIKLLVLSPHEVWLEEVAAVTIVLKLALTET